MPGAKWTMPATIAIVCAIAIACSGGADRSAQNKTADSSAAKTDTTSAAAGEVAPPVTDASTLAAMHEANQAEIAAAQVAVKKASASSVKDFAHRMIRDHRAMDAEVAKVAKAVNVTPQAAPNDSLPQHAQHEAAQVDSATGPAFDHAYMDAQVADHQTVLSLLRQDETASLNPQVKTLVGSAIHKVQLHLDEAQKVLQGLKPTA